MQRTCQVTRDGEIIGKHDEPTMLALLNAGALRLSDTYWHPGMRQPASLADLLCHRQAVPWRKLVPWVLFGTAILSILVALLANASPKAAPPPSSHDSMDASSTARPDEIRRGVPVIVGRFEASSSEDERAFPLPSVSRIAMHSRVAIIAFDHKHHSLRLSSGVVVDDGSVVLASMSAIAGAHRVEIHLANGSIVTPDTMLADDDIAVFRLAKPSVPVRWGEGMLALQSPVALAPHPLGNQPTTTAHIRDHDAGAVRVHYLIDKSLPATADGSAVLDSAGDLAGVVVDAMEGRVLRAADIRMLVAKGTFIALTPLASNSATPQPWPLSASEAEIVEGEAFVTLHNQGGETLHRIVLHLLCYPTPSEAIAVHELEARLRYAAVQSGSLDGETSPEAVAVRQTLREVGVQLDQAQLRLREARELARSQPLRSEIQVIECELPAASRQRIALAVNAASHWSVEVTVLEAVP